MDAKKNLKSEKLESEKRLAKQRQALTRLSVDPVYVRGSLAEATQVLIETAAEAINCERTSVWLLSEDGRELCCIGLYELSKKVYRRGDILKVAEYPSYFAAINKESRVYAADTYKDPRTIEFSSSYLDPNRITALLDAGIFIEGKLVGVLSFEDTGTSRTWHPDDESFVSIMASMFAELLIRDERVKLEKTLHEERSQLLSIFDSISEAIYVADPSSYELLYANEALKKTFGKDPVGGLCYRELQGFDSPCSFCTNAWIIENKGKACRWEHYNPLMGKTYLLTDQIINWPGGREVRLEMAIDISEQKKAEKILEQNRDWYRALAEDIPVLVTRVSPDGKVTYANNASIELIDKPYEEIIGHNFYSLVPEPYREQLKEAFSSLTPEEPLVVYEHFNRSRLLRWKNRAIFDEYGKIKEYFTVGEDITAYRAAEDRLRDSEARNRALVKALPDLIFSYGRDGRYIDAEIKDPDRLTEQGRRLYQEGKLIGSNIRDVFRADQAEQIIAGIEKVLKYHELQVLEYKYPVGDQIRFHEARMVPSGPDEVMSIVRDISDWKLVEEALQYQLHFEQVVADISSRFVSVPTEKIDDAINHALKVSGEFFNADRSYISKFSEDMCCFDNTHEWCAEGIGSVWERNQNFPVNNNPWWVEQIFRLEHVYVPDINKMPPEAALDQEDFIIERIKSLLTIPLVREGKVFGFFGFDAVKEKRYWTDQQISLLKVVAEIIAGAIINADAREALQESEERYREILTTIEEGYYEADLQGNITYCNDAACRLFGGYSREELTGVSYKKLYKEPEFAFKSFHRVFATGRSERGLVLEMIRKDGSIGFGELSISLMKDKEGYITGFKGIGKDVTERIERQKRLEYLSLHDQLTGIFNRAYFEAELDRLARSREYPITIISADLDGLKLVNDTMGHDQGDMLLKKCSQVLKESLRESDLLARVGGDEFSAILPRTDKPTGESIVRRMRESVILYNEDHDDLPLGISLGVATAESCEGSLKELFKRADDMMYRDKLYRSSSSRGRIVQSLLAALAERDYITEGHARRLEDLCRQVGERINLSSYQLADLALLAQVHDLGKVGIPDSILFKPGPLSDEEWEVMRGHPEKGYRIASSSPDLAGIADLILKHHERWDGSGYPLGLIGKEIPIECRILAIVDAFDAMTNKRPYNILKTEQEAMQEIIDNSGRQFDPKLVPAFLAVLKEEKA